MVLSIQFMAWCLYQHQLRVALPLTRLDEAREEMEKFIQSRLEELRSQQETRNLIGELSSRIMDHRGRVCQLLCSEPLRHPEVVPLILVGMAADRPLESNFFPGLLEGLLVQGGSLSTSIGGWLGPVLSPPRGSSGWSLGLGRPHWERSTTRVGIRCPRHQLPLEVGDKME